MSRRLLLDEIVDPSAARVVVERDAAGHVRSARFDLAGLPRVDGLLVGRPVAGVPALVERLCGICPAAHHLAGVRALEALVGGVALSPTARAVRALLHHGAAVETLAARFAGGPGPDADAALVLRRFARAAAAAAGSPGHFPVTAVPGGVVAAVTPAARAELAALVAPALAAASGLALGALGALDVLDVHGGTDPAGGAGTVRAGTVRAGTDGAGTDAAGDAAEVAFDGADVALVDGSGRPDLLGERLRVVTADGTVLEPGAPAAELDRLLAEAVPGDPAPRPYLRALGPGAGAYRVGPVAQLRVGPLTTPHARDLQERWSTRGGARAARAILVVHAVEAVAALLDLPELVAGEPRVAVPELGASGSVGSVGVGWVDGPRGLLVHRYAVGPDGVVTAATILTPTAQNEPWLAGLLARAAAGDGPGGRPGALEAAVREADPCLPCTSAPEGRMGLEVVTTDARGDG